MLGIAPDEAEAPPRQGGAERVLVVDDEEVVRRLLEQMLVDLGYEVTAVASAHEAIALAGAWDLLVVDVVMPETDGASLAQKLDARHVLFISGYDPGALVSPNATFLQKPFSHDDLARTVRQLLDQSATGVHASAPATAR